jgi:hypothetical protein
MPTQVEPLGWIYLRSLTVAALSSCILFRTSPMDNFSQLLTLAALTSLPAKYPVAAALQATTGT